MRFRLDDDHVLRTCPIVGQYNQLAIVVRVPLSFCHYSFHDCMRSCIDNWLVLYVSLLSTCCQAQTSQGVQCVGRTLSEFPTLIEFSMSASGTLQFRRNGKCNLGLINCVVYLHTSYNHLRYSRQIPTVLPMVFEILKYVSILV